MVLDIRQRVSMLARSAINPLGKNKKMNIEYWYLIYGSVSTSARSAINSFGKNKMNIKYWYMDHRTRAGDEMGLGKTIQALAVACAYREDWPFLVVAPASLRANWQNEARKWVPGLTKENTQVRGVVANGGVEGVTWR